MIDYGPLTNLTCQNRWPSKWNVAWGFSWLERADTTTLRRYWKTCTGCVYLNELHTSCAFCLPRAWNNLPDFITDCSSSLTHSLLSVTPAVGRSAFHVDRSSATVHASAAASPVSRTIWLIREVRGRPAGRLQPWCGVSPDMAFTTSFSACVLVCCQTGDGCGQKWNVHHRALLNNINPRLIYQAWVNWNLIVQVRL